MILLTRVDHRLLHGQVALSWTNNIGADCILIANNSVVNDELRKTTMKLAKPQGVKLVVKNIDDSIKAIKSGVTDKYKLFIVVESIKDAYLLAKDIKEIKHINLGGTKVQERTKNISKAVNIFPEDEDMLNELKSSGVEIEIRQVPTDNKIIF